jgi:hypothetical protein
MIRSPGAEPRDQVKRKRALQGCNHRRGITWWGLIRADVGSVGESTRSRAASSLGCCFGCCLSPTSDEKTPACLENPLPCFPCATQAHPLVVALYSRGSRPEFADAFLRQITTSNRDDFLSKARAGTAGRFDERASSSVHVSRGPVRQNDSEMGLDTSSCVHCSLEISDGWDPIVRMNTLIKLFECRYPAPVRNETK